MPVVYASRPMVWPHLTSWGLVDTEGVRDHVAKARRVDLPHVKFFDTAFQKAAEMLQMKWMDGDVDICRYG